jgi:hypothetical protein
VVGAFKTIGDIMETSPKRDHQPDRTRLPACVTGWQEVDSKRLWEDGTRIIVAVPICGGRDDLWHYEFEVVVIRCDEDFCDIETNAGDAWGWELEDVDFYVELK